MKINLFILSLLILPFLTIAQEEQEFEFDYTITSDAFGDDRNITVYLPPSFYKYPDDKFTVTYILDGHFDPFIDLGVKIIEYNTYMYKYTPTIVVGIHAKKRGWEFSAPDPTDEDDMNYKGGRAPELQRHLKDEVIPFVDSIYGKRLLDFRNLIGHSSGGAFVLWSLFSDERDIFDGYISISPGIRSDSEYILENIDFRLKNGERFNKFLYCSSGTVGEREELFGGAVARIDSMLNVYPDHGLLWRKSTFEGTGHWTCVPPSFNTAMVELTRAFRVDEKTMYDFAANEEASMVDQIEAFYAERKKQYGFVEIPLPGYLKSTAWELMDKKKYKASLGIYDWGLQQHPDNYTLMRARALLLVEMKKNKMAADALGKVLERLEGVKDKMSEERYQSHKEYLGKKLKEVSED